MCTLTVIAGPNGSGKSTLTAAEPFEGRANLVDPDAIARDLNPFAPALAAGAAGREALTRWRGYLRHRVSFAVETTLAGNGILTLMRAARAAGYTVNLFYVALTSAELNVRRVRMRASQGGHDVPADEAVVFDNSGYRRQRLLEARNGSITWRALRLPDWAHDIARALSSADPPQ